MPIEPMFTDPKSAYITLMNKLKRCGKSVANLKRKLALSIVALAVVPVVQAAPIVIGFDGNVKELMCGLCGPFDAGDSVLGQLSYDTDAIDLAPSDTDFGRYQLSGPGHGISLLIDNAYYYALTDLEVFVWNNRTAPNLSNPCGTSYEYGLTAYDQIQFRSTQNGTQVSFYNCSAEALVSDALVPLTQIGTGPTDYLLGGYDGDRYIQIVDDPYNGNSHQFSINIDRTFAVSEPFTVALFGFGLVGLGFSMRKAKP